MLPAHTICGESGKIIHQFEICMHYLSCIDDAIELGNRKKGKNQEHGNADNDDDDYDF